MFGLFKKKQLPKKLLLLSALPDNKDTFMDFAMNGESDFLRSLQNLHGIHEVEKLWRKYESSANALCTTFKEVKNRGGDVIPNFSLNDLTVVNQYDIIIIIAHHSDSSDDIEIEGKLVRSFDFVNAIPQQTQAIFDMTSCYSAYLIPKIKAHIPLSRIIGIEVKTKLEFRLFILEKVIQSLSKHNASDYISVLKDVLSSLPSNNEASNAIAHHEGVYLGGKLQSTVFAPREAKVEEDFLVSVFLHKSEDTDEVELIAREIDESAEKRNSKRLSFKIKKGDRVEFQLSTSSQLAKCFNIDKSVKGFVWDGEINSVEFIVSVLKDCSASTFVGKIKTSINKEPIGDMAFKTEIVNERQRSKYGCAEFEFLPYDRNSEMKETGIFLKEKLLQRIEFLRKQSLNKKELSDELAMCMKCKEILESVKTNKNQVLKVFISSTSDMKPFRKVVKERVEACEMYPDMYEN